MSEIKKSAAELIGETPILRSAVTASPQALKMQPFLQN